MQHLDRFCALASTSAQQPATPSRTWSWDRVLAAVLVLSAVPAGAAVLLWIGPAFIEQARETALAAADAFKDAFESQFAPGEECPPGMAWDPDLEFCYTE